MKTANSNEKSDLVKTCYWTAAPHCPQRQRPIMFLMFCYSMQGLESKAIGFIRFHLAGTPAYKP